jgi:hypothetical protein
MLHEAGSLRVAGSLSPQHLTQSLDQNRHVQSAVCKQHSTRQHIDNLIARDKHTTQTPSAIQNRPPAPSHPDYISHRIAPHLVSSHFPIIKTMTPAPATPTLKAQLSAFQAEVRSLFVELGAEIRTEQVQQQIKLDETLNKIEMGRIAIHRLQERVDALGREIGGLQCVQGVKVAGA